MEVNLTADAATSAETGSQSGQEKGQTAARLYALQGNPTKLGSFTKLCEVIENFQGVDFSFVDIQDDWSSADVGEFANQICTINKQAKCEQFVILLAAEVPNISQFASVLGSVASSVQLVSIKQKDRTISDENLKKIQLGLQLREDTDFFILATFSSGLSAFYFAAQGQ